MGVEGVRIYHDQALYKEPHGGHTPWHQDQIYWPLDTDKTITMWMPLVPISEEVGSMTFASESHRIGYINKMVISDESHRTLAVILKAKGMKRCPMAQWKPEMRPSMQVGRCTAHLATRQTPCAKWWRSSTMRMDCELRSRIVKRAKVIWKRGSPALSQVIWQQPPSIRWSTADLSASNGSYLLVCSCLRNLPGGSFFLFERMGKIMHRWKTSHFSNLVNRQLACQQ